MSKTFIKPLTTHGVHKLLYARQTQEKPQTKPSELTEAYDKLREENRKIYKKKCEYFLAGVKQLHSDNYDIFIHHKSNVKKSQENLTCDCREGMNCGEPAVEEKEDSKDPNGGVFRRKSKRYFTDTPVISHEVKVMFYFPTPNII